jgi:hypothetical protein
MAIILVMNKYHKSYRYLEKSKINLNSFTIRSNEKEEGPCRFFSSRISSPQDEYSEEYKKSMWYTQVTIYVKNINKYLSKLNLPYTIINVIKCNLDMCSKYIIICGLCNKQCCIFFLLLSLNSRLNYKKQKDCSTLLL